MSLILPFRFVVSFLSLHGLMIALSLKLLSVLVLALVVAVVAVAVSWILAETVIVVVVALDAFVEGTDDDAD